MLLFNPGWLPRLFFWLAVCLSLRSDARAQDVDARSPGQLRDHLVFLSSFDQSTTAEVAAGDGRLFTAEARRNPGEAKPGLHDPDVAIAPGQGLIGDALEFKKKDRRIIFYKAEDNVAYDPKAWSGSVSFWMQLDPAKDLEPGYCDPIQITDVGYNDAAIWVDFTKDNPRDFRLGVIGDLKAWNPNDVPPDNNPEFERRLITVTTPPFARDKWTHVLINFSGLNTAQGKSQLYLNGQAKGTLEVKDPFTWDEGKARILLGLNYIGLLDELAIFNRPLTEEEVRELYQSKGASLRRQP